MPQFTQVNDIARILSHPTWDIIVVFAVLAAGFFYGIMAGKRRIAAVIIYTYVAFAIASAFELAKSDFTCSIVKSDFNSFFVRTGVFLGIFFLLAFTLGSRRSRSFAPPSSWWQIFLLSFLQIGLLIHLILNFLPQDQIKMLAPITRTVFADPELHIWWLLVPMAVLILMRRFESRDE